MVKRILKAGFINLFSLVFFSCVSSSADAQLAHNIRDIFLVLPDSIFTNVSQLNFAEKDSFPISERQMMLQNFEAQKRLADSLDPRYKITYINETNHLLRCTNDELNLNLKVWALPNDEELIAIDGNYKDDWTSQTVKFYKYKGGKLTPAKPLPELYSISLFFDTAYLAKQKMDEDYPVPNVVLDFSPTTDDIRARMQLEMFDPEYFGISGVPIMNVDFAKKKHEWRIYSFKDGKFELTK